MERELARPTPQVKTFADQLLRSGITLVNLIGDLTDALVENGSDEDAAALELVEMVMGTLAVRLGSIPAADLLRAAELMDLALEGVIADLMRAAEPARQRERRVS